MKKIICILILLFTFSGCSLTSVSSDVISFDGEKSVGEVAKYISPAVVGISGISNYSSSVGSGVCVSKDGYILTNSHVIHNCNDIVIYLYDKSTSEAKVVYEDTILDFAILKSNIPIPYLLLGDSELMSVGDDILAVGTPLSLNLTHTFTKGIVSATNRTLKVSGSDGEGYMQNLIQHDASLNPGNSGGPLINSSGEVVGINTLKIASGEGIGFAIPTKSFISLLDRFVEDEDYQVPKLGVYGVDSEIAKFNNKTNLSKGFYVIDVNKESQLKLAGLNNGDVITKINDTPIANTLDFKNALYKHKVNDVIMIEYYHNGKLNKCKIKL